MTLKLPDHKCGLFLQHNVHRDYYQKAEEWIIDQDEHYCWPSDEAKQRAIDTDEVWTLQWYPDTPIGFYAIAAPSLEELLEFAGEIK